jgi:putative transposase
MRTVSVKLYPTATQTGRLLQFLDVSRWVYNRALDQRIKAWRRRKESVSVYSQSALLTQWRSRLRFLADVPVRIERGALRRVDQAVKDFWRRRRAGIKHNGFPRFKPLNRWRAFEILQPANYVRGELRIFVPGVGEVRCRGLRAIETEIKGIRILKKASGWYAQLLTVSQPGEQKPIRSAVGIDVGLSAFATLSTGEKIKNPRWRQVTQRRLSVLRRRSRRRITGSGRQIRAAHQFAICHERIANRRRDWLHKLTKRLIGEFDLIAIEDLALCGLSRSRHAGSILDAAWGEFARQLGYKAESAGCQLVRVNPCGTSQECSACGNRGTPKSLDDRVHVCHCGYTADRDVNAAKNILNRVPQVMREFTRGECSLAGEEKSSEARHYEPRSLPLHT